MTEHFTLEEGQRIYDFIRGYKSGFEQACDAILGPEADPEVAAVAPRSVRRAAPGDAKRPGMPDGAGAIPPDRRSDLTERDPAADSGPQLTQAELLERDNYYCTTGYYVGLITAAREAEKDGLRELGQVLRELAGRAVDQEPGMFADVLGEVAQ